MWFGGRCERKKKKRDSRSEEVFDVCLFKPSSIGPIDLLRFQSPSYLFKHPVAVGALLFLVPLVDDGRSLRAATASAGGKDLGGLFLLLPVADAAHLEFLFICCCFSSRSTDRNSRVDFYAQGVLIERGHREDLA